MKIFLLILVVFISNFLISCGESENTIEDTDKCAEVDCYDNSICKIIDNKGSCVCDSGYEFSPTENKCVKDEVDLCDINPCTEDHKTVCTVIEKDGSLYAECSCDSDFILNEENKCVKNEVNLCGTNPCTEDHKTVCTVVEKDGSSYAECSCDSDFILNEENKCVKSEVDLCDNNPCTEEHKTICSVVEKDGSLYAECSCDSGFILNEENKCDCEEGYIWEDNICKKIPEIRPVLTEDEFNSIFRNPIASGKSNACPGYDFYNYSDFINATEEYPEFGNEGSDELQKREVAAFLANISHETTGGWDNAPGGENGRYLWGLCWIDEIGCEDGSCTQYCQSNNETYPCASNKTYHGRGPIQLTWNYNYGAMGEHIGVDLLNNPELVSTDASISFRTALWFWMTPQSPKPSAHDVMVGNWIPDSDDLDENRIPGFGMTVNIINGGAECGRIDDSRVNDRVNHFKYFCELLTTTTGDNLYCDEMQHYKK